MKKVLLSFFALSCTVASNAQASLNESFNDGNFTANPIWSGNTTDWTVVTTSQVSTGANGSNTLQLDVQSGSGTKYLSTQIPSSWGVEQVWGFWIGRRAQAATAANTSYVWLWTNEANITSNTVDGYRIRFGDDGGGDEIYLEVVTDGVATPIITSVGSIPNGLQDYGFLVRVTRNISGVFSLYTSVLPIANETGATAEEVPNGTNANILQGTAANTIYTNFTNGYLAVAALHSTGGPAREAAEFDQIILLSSANATLPVKFSNLKASKKASGIEVSFSNLTEKDVVNYTIERSAGSDFSAISEVAATRNNDGRADYTITDVSPLSGVNIYRIKATELSGKTMYSSIVKIDLASKGAGLVIAPNPSKGSSLGLQFSDLPAGAYQIRIFNAGGLVVGSQKMNHSGGSLSETMTLNNLKSGLYHVEVLGAIKLQKQFIVQ